MEIFMLVISMWGHTGKEWQYMENQIVLNQDMTKQQCEYMAADERWTTFYSNEYYKMEVQCYPKSCQGKDKCD